MSISINEFLEQDRPFIGDSIMSLSLEVRSVTGCYMIPSQAPGAQVRFVDSNSLHAVGADKSGKTRALDYFIYDNQIAKFIQLAQTVKRLGGLGVYFDADVSRNKRMPLAHIDDRPGRLLWVCPDRDKERQPREYIYYINEPVRYCKVMSEELAKYGYR